MSDAINAIFKASYNNLNYVLDDEVLQVLKSNSQHKLVIAPAGGTKTTLGEVQVMKYNLDTLAHAINFNVLNPDTPIARSMEVSNINVFVYNNHNVEDIHSVRSKIYNSIENLKVISSDFISNKYVNPRITVTTLHKFAKDIILDNYGSSKIKNMIIASDYIVSNLMASVLKKVLGFNGNVKDYLDLYNLYVNLMLYDVPPEELFDDVQFRFEAKSKDVDEEHVSEIFTLFERVKVKSKTYQYSDWFKIAIKILEEPLIQKNYHNNLKIVVADEIQDFTKIMFRMFSLLVGPDCKTLAIGDADQAIYQYSGADPNNIYNYSKITGIDAEVFKLQVNRRCSKKSFTFAKNIRDCLAIEDKYEIVTTRPNGRLDRKEYESLADEAKIILDELEMINYRTNAILFRKADDAMLLSRILYKKNMNVGYVNASSYTRHKLYSGFRHVLNKVIIARGRDVWKDLYKLLPFSKETLRNFLDMDATNKPRAFTNIDDWLELDFSPLFINSKSRRSIVHQLIFVKGIVMNLSITSTSTYIHLLLEMYVKNYYNYTRDLKDIYEIESVHWVMEDFTGANNLRKTLEILDSNQSNINRNKNSGIVISTIHGSKGLEFDRVILCRMEDRANKVVLDAQEAEYKMECEARVFYVASTRQKDALVVLVSKENPHPLASEVNFIQPLDYTVKPEFKEVNNNTLDNLFQGSNDFGNSVGMKRNFKL